MYTNHPPYKFVFNSKDYQANIWLDKTLFGKEIDFISHPMTPLSYEVFHNEMNFKIFDKLGNFIILNIKNMDMVRNLYKATKIGIITGSTEAIKKQDVKELNFTHASLI